MSRSCIVKEFPIPEREYRVSPPAQWDRRITPRPAPARRTRRPRHRRSALSVLILMGLALFCCGFLLGRVSAVPRVEAVWSITPEGTIQPEEPTAGGVRILGIPGAEFHSSAQDGTGASAAEWSLVLINGTHPLSPDFAVPELTRLKNGHAVDSRVYPDLQAMMDAARAEGYQPLICSSYRTWDKQSELFEKKVSSCMAQASSREEAEKQAAVWVSRPGTSEHQAGLAVDIVDKEYQLLDRNQETRPVQQWLMAHCAEYGFILRYPTEKSALTGVGYEPWHYRYVGREAAAAIMDGGLCLEEYLSQ